MSTTPGLKKLSASLVAVVVIGWAGAIVLKSSASGADAAEAVWQLSFVTYGVLGALIIRRRPDVSLGWLLLMAGVLVELAALVDAYAIRAATDGWPAETAMRWLQSLLWLPALSLVLVHIPLRFPTGSIPGSRWRWVSRAAVAVVATATVSTAFAPGPIGDELPIENPLGIAALEGLLKFLAGCGALLLPLGIASFLSLLSRRHESVRQHLQLRWFGFSLVLACLVALVSLSFQNDEHFSTVLGPLLVAVAVVVPAIGIAVAVLRHRLYGIDAIISRSTAYGIVSAAAAAAALGSATLISAFVGHSTNASAVVAAVVAAFTVRGSWQWVQRRVDRAVYGERGDPLRAIRLLGDRLELAGSIDDALEVAASTLASSLRLPFVRIRIRNGPTVIVGKAGGPIYSLPIATQGSVVADLEVGVRRGQTELDRPDEELIGEVARSIGPLCQAAVLAGELRRSMDRLAEARDEERKRIHRDLHDGLGPTLAGLALRTDILRSRAGADLADELVALERELKNAFHSVTKMIDGLRPKLLDDRGLAAGLAEHCAALTATTSPPLNVRLRTTGALSELGPSVESAAWYIASEALNNVVRHSGARSCSVDLSLDDRLEIVISDDGRGVGPSEAASSGRTGLRSMTSRADAVGGRCRIESNEFGGTTVHAVLPLEAR